MQEVPSYSNSRVLCLPKNFKNWDNMFTDGSVWRLKAGLAFSCSKQEGAKESREHNGRLRTHFQTVR